MAILDEKEVKDVVVATYLIKVKGEFDKRWSEKELREYIKEKIKKEIDDYYHPDLELLKIKGNEIEVWVYISALFGIEDIERYAKRWLKNHIKEKGLSVKGIEVEQIIRLEDLFDERKPKYIIHLS